MNTLKDAIEEWSRIGSGFDTSDLLNWIEKRIDYLEQRPAHARSDEFNTGRPYNPMKNRREIPRSKREESPELSSCKNILRIISKIQDLEDEILKSV